IAQLTLNGILGRVPIAAVDLQSAESLRNVRLRNEQFGDCGVEDRVSPSVLHGADLVKQEAAGLNRHLHIYDSVSDRRETRDRLVELAARLRIGNGVLEEPLHAAQMGGEDAGAF